MPIATTTDTRDRFVSVGDLRLHCRVWGHPHARPAVLLHGLTGNAWEWDVIAAELAKRLYVVAVDQRGHGASDWADDYAADCMVEDIEALCDELELESPAIVGHSWAR